MPTEKARLNVTRTIRHAVTYLSTALPELAAHRHTTSQIGGTPGSHQYRVGTKLYPRVLGQAGAHEKIGRAHV